MESHTGTGVAVPEASRELGWALVSKDDLLQVAQHTVWSEVCWRLLAEAHMKASGGMHAHPSCDIGCQIMTALLRITQLACAYQQATNFGAFSAKSCGPAAGCCLLEPMDD